MHPALLFLRFGGFVGILGGGYYAVSGLRKILLARSSRSWPQVPGDVLALEASRYQKFDGTRDFEEIKSAAALAAEREGDGAASRPRVVPRVRYRYEVDGQTLEGTCIFFGGEQLAHTSRVAASYLAPYKVGARVPVYYQPGKPEVSVLEPGARGRSAIEFAMGVALLMVGLVLSLLAWTAFTPSE